MATMLITTEKMEEAIDRDGAWNVLIAMELVLSEKADHIRATYGDGAGARRYEIFSKKCGALARLLEANDI